MIKNVLIIDDDKSFLKLFTRKFESDTEHFNIITTESGQGAFEILKNNSISLVLTDLHLPKYDGFTIIDHITSNFADIPVIVVTGQGKPKTESVVLKAGARSYYSKPVDFYELEKDILDLLAKQEEGGKLFNASLEMFLQLIEMEQKSCTIRVYENSSGLSGVLFLKNGDLLNARIGDTQGINAAYEIISWEKVTLSIEESCFQKSKIINVDLQGILLEAMRLKDEARVKRKKESLTRTNDNVSDNQVDSSPSIQENPFTELKNKLESAIGKDSGIEDIYQDNSFDELIDQADIFGKLFGAGNLKACYLSNQQATDRIIVPGKKTTVFVVNKKSPRDSLLHILTRS